MQTFDIVTDDVRKAITSTMKLSNGRIKQPELRAMKLLLRFCLELFRLRRYLQLPSDFSS
jgi:hypothetical protein